MSMSDHIKDREFGKFEEVDGETTVRVKVVNPGGGPIDSEIYLPAGETISAVKAVYQSDAEIFLGDPDESLKSNIVGITQTAGASGTLIKVTNSGSFFDSSFSFVIGEPVYLGELGLVTQAEPTQNFRVRLGFAIAQNGFNINIQEPIEQ